jgi:hypothetical protein
MSMESKAPWRKIVSRVRMKTSIVSPFPGRDTAYADETLECRHVLHVYTKSSKPARRRCWKCLHEWPPDSALAAALAAPKKETK